MVAHHDSEPLVAKSLIAALATLPGVRSKDTASPRKKMLVVQAFTASLG
jgi:hypothetical protein